MTTRYFAEYLDRTPPIMVLDTETATKISRVSGKNSTDITFHTNEAFIEYDIRVVSSGAADHTAGSRVKTGTVASTTSTTVTITGDDVATADPGDGNKIVKIFAKDYSGNWSA